MSESVRSARDTVEQLQNLQREISRFRGLDFSMVIRLDHYDLRSMDARDYAQQSMMGRSPFAFQAVEKGLEVLLRHAEERLRELERQELKDNLKARGLPEDFQDAVKVLLGGTE